MKYYAGSCELCHVTFMNLTRWGALKMYLRHKHLLRAILHSNAGFSQQDGYIDPKDIMGVE